MKKIIRLTESDLHGIVKEAVSRLISEDGDGAMGGGATSDAGINANGSGDPTLGVTYPFGGVMRRSIYGRKNKKGGNNTGKPFYEPAKDTHPGFSMERKK